jgi:nucleotide-binding universal stress UspA family protein
LLGDPPGGVPDALGSLEVEGDRARDAVTADRMSRGTRRDRAEEPRAGPGERKTMTTNQNAQGAPRTSALCLVVGLDFKDTGGAAFDQAARIAKRVPGSAIHLVHVFDEAPGADAARTIKDHLRLYVNEKAAALGGFPGMTVGIHIRSGKVSTELSRFAVEVGADMLVIGARPGPHLKSWIVGSIADKLAAEAPCAVLVAGVSPPVATHVATAIEPVCTDCARARSTTNGKQWWCARHAEHAGRQHAYSYQRELPLNDFDSNIVPTGADLTASDV